MRRRREGLGLCWTRHDMNFLRIARRIAFDRTAGESGGPSEVSVYVVMHDGDGAEVEYEVECSVGSTGFDVSKVERVDTMQDVDPESFKVVFGRASLEKLQEAAEARATEIEEARATEELGTGGDTTPESEPEPESEPTEQSVQASSR